MVVSKESIKDEEAAAHNRVVTFAGKQNIAGHPVALAKLFLRLCKAASGAEDAQGVQNLGQQVLAELTFHKLLLGRNRLEADVALADQRACQDMQQRLETDIQAVKDETARLRDTLEESKIYRQRQQEYESLKKLIMQYPKRADTQQQISNTEAEIVDYEMESARLDSQLEGRKKQFMLLAHVLRDLKNCIQDEALLEADVDEGVAKMDTDD